MSKPTVIRKDTLTDIAEAIREKTETTELIPTVEMAQRIRDIETLPTDATATEVDLLVGKVAYNNDGRFVGTIETFSGENEGDTSNVENDYSIFLRKLLIGEEVDLSLDFIESMCDYSLSSCSFSNVNLTNLKKIGFSSIGSNDKITYLYFENLEEIGQRNFISWTKLEEVYLKKVNKIGNVSFRNCVSLKNFYLEYNGVVALEEEPYIFGGEQGGLINVHVPYILINDYTNNEKWKYLIDNNIITIVGDL